MNIMCEQDAEGKWQLALSDLDKAFYYRDGFSHVLASIDGFEKLLVPEMERELARWGGSMATWQADVDRLRTFLTRYDHWAMLEESLRQTMGLSDEEAAQVFGK